MPFPNTIYKCWRHISSELISELFRASSKCLLKKVVKVSTNETKPLGSVPLERNYILATDRPPGTASPPLTRQGEQGERGHGPWEEQQPLRMVHRQALCSAVPPALHLVPFLSVEMSKIHFCRHSKWERRGENKGGSDRQEHFLLLPEGRLECLARCRLQELRGRDAASATAGSLVLSLRSLLRNLSQVIWSHLSNNCFRKRTCQMDLLTSPFQRFAWFRRRSLSLPFQLSLVYSFMVTGSGMTGVAFLLRHPLLKSRCSQPVPARRLFSQARAQV